MNTRNVSIIISFFYVSLLPLRVLYNLFHNLIVAWVQIHKQGSEAISYYSILSISVFFLTLSIHTIHHKSITNYAQYGPTLTKVHS